jgi:hypothetical protein
MIKNSAAGTGGTLLVQDTRLNRKGGLCVKKIMTSALLVLSILIMFSAGASLKNSKYQGSTPGGSTSFQAGGTPRQADLAQAHKPDASPAEVQHDIPGLKGLLSKSGTIDNYGWECTFTYQGNSVSYNYWVKGKKEKLELVSNGQGGMIFYIDGSKKVTYMCDSNSKSAIAVKDGIMQNTALKPKEFLTSITREDLSGYKKNGRQNIAGLDCTIYEYQYSNTLRRIYVSEKYQAAVKIESLVNGNVESSYLIKNYLSGTVTDEMVTMPKDTNIADFSSFES